jgi:hypothetical protein
MDAASRFIAPRMEVRQACMLKSTPSEKNRVREVLRTGTGVGEAVHIRSMIIED